MTSEVGQPNTKLPLKFYMKEVEQLLTATDKKLSLCNLVMITDLWRLVALLLKKTCEHVMILRRLLSEKYGVIVQLWFMGEHTDVDGFTHEREIVVHVVN
ncbi:hypothetical protein Dimus_034778 [Dionaea muscipula]